METEYIKMTYNPIRELDIQGFSTIKIFDPLFLKFCKEKIQDVSEDDSFHSPIFRMIRSCVYGKVVNVYQTNSFKGYLQCHFPFYSSKTTNRIQNYKKLKFIHSIPPKVFEGEVNLSERIQYYYFQCVDSELKVEVLPGHALLYSYPYLKGRWEEKMRIFYSVSSEILQTQPSLLTLIRQQENPFFKNQGRKQFPPYSEEEINLLRPLHL